MPTVGVVLSGCGYLDGSEIHEAVLTMLALDRAGMNMLIMAPNHPQMHVVNHLTGEPVPGETRNVLVESARIARGKIVDIASVKGEQVAALMFPGGYGAAKNLCDFAVRGEQASVHPEVARLVREVHAEGKWIAAVCISPVLVAKIFQEAGIEGVRLTIGRDAATAAKLATMGARHIECPVTEARIDPQHRVITTPAYMYQARVSEVAEGVDAAVKMLVAAMQGQTIQ